MKDDEEENEIVTELEKKIPNVVDIPVGEILS